MKPVDTDSQGIQTPPGDWEGQGHWRGTFQVVTSSGPKIYKCGGSAAFPPAEDPPFLLWVVALHGGEAGAGSTGLSIRAPRPQRKGDPRPTLGLPGSLILVRIHTREAKALANTFLSRAGKSFWF